MGSDSVSEESPERRFRTLFISDVHLGARGSQADRLLDFLRSHDADASSRHAHLPGLAFCDHRRSPGYPPIERTG